MGRITSSLGGVALNKSAPDPLAEWQAGIKKPFDFVADPEGYRLKLSALAMLAHRRRQVDMGELNEMLELTDAGKEWALLEWEEAYRIGLFPEKVPDPEDGFQRINGRELALGERRGLGPKFGSIVRFVGG